jgi:L-alanine-DL-glutamate epimerase-like enolase superfamily enzyme
MAIDRIEIFVTDLPGRLQRRTSSGAYDTGPKGSLMGKPVFLKLHADGVTGYGQIRPTAPGRFMADTVHSIVGAISDVYGPRLLGKELSDVELAWSMFDRSLPVNNNARALLDHALHDALGKSLGVPVYKLLGGLAQAEIPLEWSVSMADHVGEMIEHCRRAIDEFGIRVLCLKAGGPEGYRHDVDNFIAVRKAIGYDVQIGMDPNCGWSVHDTKRAITILADHRLDYLEQPVERRDLRGMASIRAMARGVPLMADEAVTSVQDAFALAAAEAVDVFCIKLYKMGGLRQAKKIAAVAESANLRVNMGGLAAFCQIEAAAGAHFYASTPLEHTMPAGEFIFGLGVIGPDPIVGESDFTIRNGTTRAPNRPGFGITIDEDALKRHTLMSKVVQ